MVFWFGLCGFGELDWYFGIWYIGGVKIDSLPVAVVLFVSDGCLFDGCKRCLK
jgi:hypothetical protein